MSTWQSYMSLSCLNILLCIFLLSLLVRRSVQFSAPATSPARWRRARISLPIRRNAIRAILPSRLSPERGQIGSLFNAVSALDGSGASSPPLMASGVRRTFRDVAASLNNKSALESPDISDTQGDASSDLLSDTHIPSWLLESLEARGFCHPTDIQERAIPVILSGRNAILQSHTGSGKTLAFAVPLLAALNVTRRVLQAVVVCPSRELGTQIVDVLVGLAPRQLGIEVLPVFDKCKDIRWREDALVAVGTPEFISEAVEKRRLSAQAVSMVVIDEVDQCFGDDDIEDMHAFLSRLLSSSYRAKTQPEDEVNDQLVQLLAHKQRRRRERQTAGRVFSGHRQIVMSSAFIPHIHSFASQCVQRKWTESEPAVVVSTTSCTDAGTSSNGFSNSNRNSNINSIAPSVGDRGDVEEYAESDIEKTLVPATVHHAYVEVEDANDKLKALERLINVLFKPTSSDSSTATVTTSHPRVLVFVDRPPERLVHEGAVAGTPYDPEVVAEHIRAGLCDVGDAATMRGDVSASSGDKEYEELAAAPLADRVAGVGFCLDDMASASRIRALRAFNDGAYAALVCSDLAARGIDFRNVTHVIQLAPAATKELYLHRSGRTGRAGRSGQAISIVSRKERFVMRRYSNALGIGEMEEMKI